jgi:hypothetical protein
VGEDNSTNDMPFVPWEWGIEVWRSELMTTYFYKRLRFIWYNPRFRENWQLDAIFNEGVLQIGLGPAVFVYVRFEDF